MPYALLSNAHTHTQTNIFSKLSHPHSSAPESGYSIGRVQLHVHAYIYTAVGTEFSFFFSRFVIKLSPL